MINFQLNPNSYINLSYYPCGIKNVYNMLYLHLEQFKQYISSSEFWKKIIPFNAHSNSFTCIYNTHIQITKMIHVVIIL